MHVLVLVVGQRAVGRGGPHHGLGDGDRRLARARSHHAGGQLKRRERPAAVAAGQSDDGRSGLIFQSIAAGKPPIVGHGTAHQLGDLIIGERMQLHDARARDEGGVHFEKRVLRGGAHKHHKAIFHRVQKRVLLAAIEPVNLVDEQDGAQASHDEPLLRRIDFPAQVGHGAPDG